MNETKERNPGDVRQQLDAELSDVNWTRGDRQVVLHSIKNGGMIMKKKLSMALVMTLSLMLLTLGALAATGVIFSSKVDATKLADAALEKAYGVTLPMQTYFTRTIEEKADETVVRYASNGAYHYVLGDYTVTLRGGETTASWSWDGTQVAESFDKAPWGAALLRQMIDVSRETLDGSKHYKEAVALAKAAGVDTTAFSYTPPTEAERDAIDKAQRETQAKVEARMQFTREELAASGREALAQGYGFTEEMLPYLTHVPENDYGVLLANGKACLEMYFGFGENEADGAYVADTHPEWSALEGVYSVTVDVETGVIEDMYYDSSLAGNG